MLLSIPDKLYRRYVIRTQPSLCRNLPKSVHPGEQLDSYKLYKRLLFAMHLRSTFNGAYATSGQAATAIQFTLSNAFD